MEAQQLDESAADPGPADPGPAEAAAPGPPTRVERVRARAAARGVPLAAILVSVGVVVLTYLAGKLIYRLRDVILLMVVAGFLALILNPFVVFIQRWVPRRGWAVTIVTICAVLIFAALVLAFGYPLANGLTSLSHRLPVYIRDAAQGQGWIGHLVRRFHLTAWVDRNAPNLQTIGAKLAKPALTFGKGAASVVTALATVAALVLLLLLEGPAMRRAALGAMSPDRAERYARVGHEINRSVVGYVLGDLLTSIIAGVVVFVALLSVGVPFPLLWALWVALVDFLPMIGGALAGIPTVLFATSHSLTAGIVTLAVFVGYQQLENHVLNPVVMSRTVRVNPLLVLVSILIGSSIGDWVGGYFGAFVAALLSIPCAAVLQIIVKEIWQATAPGGVLEDGPPGPSLAPADPRPTRKGNTKWARRKTSARPWRLSCDSTRW